MTQADMLNLTISKAATQIEQSASSPVELTDAMLQRIARVDNMLNAYITVCGQQALEVEDDQGRLPLGPSARYPHCS